MVLSDLEEDGWYKDNGDEALKILLWILDADKISNYIYDEINQVKQKLEKEGIDCRVLQKKIARGRLV